MSWLKDTVEKAFGLKAQARPSKTIEKTILVRATIAANAPAGTIAPISLIIDPVTGSVSSYKIPNGETWVIDDLYVDSTQTPNGYLRLRKNFREDALPLTPPVNSLLISNPSRPRINPIVLNSFEDLDGFYITAANNGASAATIEVKAHVTIYVA